MMCGYWSSEPGRGCRGNHSVVTSETRRGARERTRPSRGPYTAKKVPSSTKPLWHHRRDDTGGIHDLPLDLNIVLSISSSLHPSLLSAFTQAFPEGNIQSRMAAPRISRHWLEAYGFSTSLPRTEGSLVDLIPSNDDLKVLARRLDNLEIAVTLGRDKDLFNLAYCIFRHTGIEVIPGLSGGTCEPRPVDHETMALVLSAYRILDATSLTPERSLRQPKECLGLANDFTRLMDAEKPGGGDGAMDSGGTSRTTSDERFVALFKKMLRSRNKTSLSHIFDNFYACSVYLMSLCDPASVEDPFTVTRTKEFFRKWYETLPVPSSDIPAPLTVTERQRLKQMASTSSVKGLELCLEVAFMASPILLLQTFDVAKQKWVREAMLRTTFSLGNDKPSTMVGVERALYGSIFDIAFAGATCSHSLSRTVAIIENGLGDPSTTVPGWFQTEPAVTSRDKDEDGGHDSDDDPDLEESDRPKKRLRLTYLESAPSAPSRPTGLDGCTAPSFSDTVASLPQSRTTYGYDFGQPTLLSSEVHTPSTPDNTGASRLSRRPSAPPANLHTVSAFDLSPVPAPVPTNPSYAPLWTLHHTLGAVFHSVFASSP
ncbi:hypothetical protein NMY22_g1771 [Coprinellus aureogranulatus]|nr:hypothetical protein NMY22_g1771 [Coprinellus aureogranulatus]